MTETSTFLISYTPIYFPGGASGPECSCRRCKRCGLDTWVRKIPWRRAWQPTPVFLLGECYRQRSLAGYSLQGRKELDTTEVTQPACIPQYKIKSKKKSSVLRPFWFLGAISPHSLCFQYVISKNCFSLRLFPIIALDALFVGVAWLFKKGIGQDFLTTTFSTYPLTATKKRTVWGE